MARKRVPAEFKRAVDEHRNKLQKVLTTKAANKLKGVYDEAQASLTDKLRRSVKAKKGDTFTAVQHRIFLGQLRQGQAVIAKRLAGEMSPLSRQAQETALKGLVSDVATLSKKFTGVSTVLPIEETAVLQGIIDENESSMIKMHQNSFANYGVNITQKVEGKLSLSLLSAQPTHELIDDVAEMVDGEWWQGERIVRTEMAYAYNRAHRDGITESSEELPDLMQRWEEHCDADGQPLDDRVAVDSIAIHGQVVKAGGLFYMPATAPFPDAEGNTTVPSRLVGLAWEFPPNRPNDRSVLAPWMPDWGVPGWRYSNGRRVPL